MTDDALLLYDGTCGFCAERVQFVLRHDRRGTLRFASLQGPTGSAIRARHPEVEGVDSVLWVERANGNERLLIKSAAALQALSYLGGGWRWLGALARIVPRVVRDAAYDLIARHRHRLVAGGAQCLVPTPEQRARFLE